MSRPRRSRARIDAIIRDKHDEGKIPSDIGSFVGLNAAEVRQRLIAMKLTPHGRDPHGKITRSPEDIDAFILARRGREPSAIAHALKIATAEARERMIALGIELNDGFGPKFEVHRMWTKDNDDDLREAIWKRQRAGARETLRAAQ